MKTDGTTIECFRGDSGHIYISKTDSDGNIEKFVKGDRVIFTIKNNFGEIKPVLRKIFDVQNDTEELELTFTKDDTLIGELISEAVDFEYDISVNGEHTILGHGSDGAKIFRLYPTGSVDV